ncbi:MAG: YdcF family protein [Alphaproteobacteria bacterium]|nr:YdcF family protein [Alphaproteobacteria bacterium]
MAEIPPEPARERRTSKLAGLIVLAGMLVSIALIVGFFRFTSALEQQVQLSDKKADAIVVLTGATGRIRTGLELLRSKKGKRLLISGVHPATTSKQLVEATKTSKEVFSCCVDLGRVAKNTIGNALEAADWANKNNYKSLILVTSAFHMPRTLIEFGNAMPGLRLIPHPVKMPSQKWWTNARTAARFAREYSKLILSWVRTGLFPGTRTSQLANSGAL